MKRKNLFSSLKWPSRHRHRLNATRDEIYQHGTGIRSIVMQVFSANCEQGKFSHEFFVLRAAMLGINEVEFFDIRCILDDSA